MKRSIAILLVAASLVVPAWAGPYAGALGTPDDPYGGVPGWVGPVGDGYADTEWYPNPGNYLNPIFVGWASEVVAYAPAGYVTSDWTDPSYALGPALGDEYDVVSLGDMDETQIAAHLADPANPSIVHPGFITLGFDEPIYDGVGADLAVFENGFCRTNTPDFFAELAYVEVSTDGATFARFPCRSLNGEPDEQDRAYAMVDVTNVFGLAGKNANAHGLCWGTPFDLSDLADRPEVVGGAVDLYDIRFVRIVDIPGSGDFLDSAGDPIYDGWRTGGSGGFDLDAVGVLHAGAIVGDANSDGRVDLADFVVLKSNFGKTGGWDHGDFNGDGTVDLDDFVLLKTNFGR